MHLTDFHPLHSSEFLKVLWEHMKERGMYLKIIILKKPQNNKKPKRKYLLQSVDAGLVLSHSVVFSLLCFALTAG